MELKNCPFCGSWVDIYDNCKSSGADEFWAQCQNKEDCFATGTAEPNFDSAVKSWNTRPLEDALRARLEAAEAYIQAMETRDAVEAQPECFDNHVEWLNECGNSLQKILDTRAEWERVKNQGDI